MTQNDEDRDVRPLRWGVMGTGGIAAAFTVDLTRSALGEVVAVGSRSQETADAFAARLGVARAHGSYEALLDDADIDAVYVATPHPWHHPLALAAIDTGRAVLVEKPFTVNAAEARELVAAARERGSFLMEAMWTRFLPHTQFVREMLASGRLGEIRTVEADHGQWFVKDEAHRLFAPGLAGGALLDLGVYPVSFASMVLGTPDRILAMSTPAFTGVDAHTSMVFGYASGAQAVLDTTLEAVSPTVASVTGTDGFLTVSGPFYAPARVDVVLRDGSREAYADPYEGHGLRAEAEEVARCVAAGRTESALLPLDESVSIMATMDEVRRQIGLRYPGE